MKYLTPYKLFESNETNYDDIKETIKDILLPISDMGYEIVVTDNLLYGELTGLIIGVVDYNDPLLKVNDEVKEEFIRMADYLESEGFDSIKVIVRFGHYQTLKSSGRVDFSKFISIDGGNITSLVFVAEFN